MEGEERTDAKYLLYLQLTGVTLVITRVVNCEEGSSDKPVNPMPTKPAAI